MAEAPKVELISIEEGFPHSTVPTIFCDGIANLAPSPHVVKFYLFRQDPDQTGKPKYKNQILAQIVMTVPGFIYTVLLGEQALKQFVEQGTIPQETIDNIKSSIQKQQ